ncbi:hypothetical protein M404DRAFT_1008029 [Pisolithus tinctorius Marx 270]|uniref:Uncharacterized protein n=1 Tax=Pisolithus tinctorius Marx 270 TaxID=870435 RepID=A0A0C3NGD0_PISTI|nr:hypothetical protein M404DRAFT_1008029 [Pisolithus tinctorius Marx 270]
MHTVLLTEEGTLQTNNGRGETASNDGGECSEHAEKETEGICLREWTARKVRGTVLECARYDERTSR